LPSDFEVIDLENKQGIMQAFSMVGVEMKDLLGNDLQLTKAATIEFPINEELLPNAPETIALSHLDEETGYWTEQTEAFLSNNVYKAEVTHFSFWCAYVMHDPTFIFGYTLEELIDPNPLNNILQDLYF